MPQGGQPPSARHLAPSVFNPSLKRRGCPKQGDALPDLWIRSSGNGNAAVDVQVYDMILYFTLLASRLLREPMRAHSELTSRPARFRPVDRHLSPSSISLNMNKFHRCCRAQQPSKYCDSVIQYSVGCCARQQRWNLSCTGQLRWPDHATILCPRNPALSTFSTSRVYMLQYCMYHPKTLHAPILPHPAVVAVYVDPMTKPAARGTVTATLMDLGLP